MFSTYAFSTLHRIGTKNLPELSKEKLSKGDLQAVFEANDEKLDIAIKSKSDILSSDTDVEEYKEYKKKSQKNNFRGVKSRLQFFEKQMSLKKKGSLKV